MILTSEDLHAIEELVDRKLDEKLEEKFKVFRKELYQDFATFIENGVMSQLDNHYQRLTSLESIHPLGQHT